MSPVALYALACYQPRRAAATRGIGLGEEASGAAQNSLILGVPGPLQSAPSAGMAWVADEGFLPIQVPVFRR